MKNTYKLNLSRKFYFILFFNRDMRLLNLQIIDSEDKTKFNERFYNHSTNLV